MRQYFDAVKQCTKLFGLGLFFLFSAHSFSFVAQDENHSYAQDNEQFYTFQSIELYEAIMNDNGEEEFVLRRKNSQDDFFLALGKSQGARTVNIDDVIMVTRKLIAFGKEIYKIVDAGKPIVTIESKPVQVLPLGQGEQVINATDLTSWKAPKVKKFRVETKNYLGVSPVVFEFMVIFSYGGQFEGKGRYITGAQIRPIFVDVKWGYKFDAAFKVQTIVNEGSVDFPIAGAVLELDSSIATILQEQKASQLFYINGEGLINTY